MKVVGSGGDNLQGIAASMAFIKELCFLNL